MKFTDIVFFKYYKPYERQLLAGAVVFLFLAVGSYLVWTYGMPKSIQTRDATDVPNTAQESQPAEFYFFTVDWCPHCTKAKPEWQSFCKQYDGELVNGYRVNCVGGAQGVNCTEDSTDTKELLTRFNVEHYPTVKMVKDNGQIIDFDTKVTSTNLGQFLTATLG
jgi:thiol-disulfide isomerase/thioredoxin